MQAGILGRLMGRMTPVAATSAGTNKACIALKAFPSASNPDQLDVYILSPSELNCWQVQKEGNVHMSSTRNPIRERFHD